MEFSEVKADYARRIAKRLAKFDTQSQWHERASEACATPADEDLYCYPVTGMRVSWYCKVTLVAPAQINVKVCYRVTGMSHGWNHMDLLLPSGAGHMEISYTVEMLKKIAREALASGVRAHAKTLEATQRCH